MSEVCIFFADGLEEIEGLTVVDLLRRADIDVSIVSITGSRTVTGAHHIVIHTDALFEDMDFSQTKLFVLPGGMPGTKHLNAHAGLAQLLPGAARQGLYIAAICAAPSVLGGLGLLKGKSATCYPGFEDKLTGADVKTEPVVIDGNIITSRGLGTAIEFSGALIGLLRSDEQAGQILDSIMYRK